MTSETLCAANGLAIRQKGGRTYFHEERSWGKVAAVLGYIKDENGIYFLASRATTAGMPDDIREYRCPSEGLESPLTNPFMTAMFVLEHAGFVVRSAEHLSLLRPSLLPDPNADTEVILYGIDLANYPEKRGGMDQKRYGWIGVDSAVSSADPVLVTGAARILGRRISKACIPRSGRVA